MAACVNRAPEGTFGCAVAEVGVLDLLKASRTQAPNVLTSLSDLSSALLVPQIHNRSVDIVNILLRNANPDFISL